MIIQELGCGIRDDRGNFTLAWRGWLLLVAVFGALCLSPAPAAADLIVSFDLNSAKLDYVAGTGTGALTVTQNVGSDILVRQEDGLDVLDSAKITDGAFDFLFELTMADETGDDNWSATGTLKFTDLDKNTDAVSGSFASTSVEVLSVAGGVLQIEGVLSNTPILQNRGDPWVFVGEETIPGEHTGDGADGIEKQITVNSPGAYEDGVVFVLKFGVGTISLDTLFGANFAKTGGEVKGYITPEPATMSLLALGGLAILRRRRRAAMHTQP